MPWIESLPIVSILVGITVIMLLACEIGYHLGKRARTRHDIEAPASLGSMVAGLLGMLGFVLAFTFSIASGHHDMRKSRVLEEANAIGTAYLRAELLEPEYGGEIKRLLREYVDLRLQTVTVENYREILDQSEQIHNRLWVEVRSAALSVSDTNSQLAVESINNVIDMHTKRAMAGLFTRIPASIWLALLAISTFCMVTMGIQIGFAGKRRLVAVIPMLFAFAVLVALVVDLDRPQSGLIKVGQQAMTDLQRTMSDHAGTGDALQM
jgi:hypothetical protein